MTYVPPVYPTTIPTAGDLPDRVDDVDWLYAARYNELKKELRAALTELGTTPKGNYETVKARLDSIFPSGSNVTNPYNLTSNGDMMLWSGGAAAAPDRWMLAGGGSVAQEVTEVPNGFINSVKLTSDADGCLLYTASQQSVWWYSKFKGKTITFSCWVYADDADTARLRINVGVAYYYSDYHKGDSNWELLTLTQTIPTNSTRTSFDIRNEGDTKIIYATGASCVMGSMPYAWSSKPLPRGGTVTAEVDETKFSHKIPIMVEGVLYYIMLTTS